MEPRGQEALVGSDSLSANRAGMGICYGGPPHQPVDHHKCLCHPMMWKVRTETEGARQEVQQGDKEHCCFLLDLIHSQPARDHSYSGDANLAAMSPLACLRLHMEICRLCIARQEEKASKTE